MVKASLTGSSAPVLITFTLSLTEFFAKVGDVRSVRMRRHLSSKDFRGSVFVELSSTEEAQRVGMECLMGQCLQRTDREDTLCISD